MTYATTVLEGDAEIAVVTAYALTSEYEMEKTGFKGITDSITGLMTAKAVVNAVGPTKGDEGKGKDSVEARLTELKKLHDGGLINTEVYLERQRSLLEATP